VTADEVEVLASHWIDVGLLRQSVSCASRFSRLYLLTIDSPKDFSARSAT
jgi:hypothetical protein